MLMPKLKTRPRTFAPPPLRAVSSIYPAHSSTLPPPAALPSNVGHVSKVRQLRHERGWSMDELARRVGVSKTTIQNWEQGTGLRSENLSALAKAFDTTMEALSSMPSRADSLRPAAYADLGDEYTPSVAPSAALCNGQGVTMDLADSEAVYLIQALLEAQDKATKQSEEKLEQASLYERKANTLGALATRVAQAFAERAR